MADVPHWFITGASAGFGLAFCLHVLRAGHRVTGSVRSRTRAADAVSQIEGAGGAVVELDLASPQATIVSAVSSLPSPVDVLVNNAGYSVLGAAEQFSADEIEQQMKTNVYGPIYVIQAVLPGMRARRSGTIVNVSSVAAKDPLPGCALYSASKMALEGFSESLYHEVAPFGIRVLVVEPGAFRTGFLSAMQVAHGGVHEAYTDSPAGKTVQFMKDQNGKQPGDAAKAVARIFEAVTGEGMAGELKSRGVMRLVLGKDAMMRVRRNNARWESEMEASFAIANSTDL